MIALAQLLRQHQTELMDCYQSKMQTPHYSAMKAIMDCHTPACGTLDYQCDSCQKQQHYYCCCGHRSCPACQHQTNNQWLYRQRQKLLPVDYFMVTFTLPYELRRFVWGHQRWAYQTLFEVAVATLASFARNDKKLGVELGMTGVLHTHSRRLEFHPHGHFVVPGGGFNKKRGLWKQKPGKYLFNGKALARVFRAKFIAAMKAQGFSVPAGIPKKWVAQCEYVGRGEPALIYLARYLYRGVISEKNILKYDDGKVTFRYKDSDTKHWKTRTETVVKFLWLVLQHVLPKGFRRIRDYGFLHGNAKKILRQLQLILRVRLPEKNHEATHDINCPCCGKAMIFLQFTRYKPVITGTTII